MSMTVDHSKTGREGLIAESCSTGLLIDDCFLKHQTGAKHPERPERLRAISKALVESGIGETCTKLPVRKATVDQVLAVHTQEYLKRFRQACERGDRYIDAVDSAICPDSYQVAMLAAGSTIEAVDQVQNGQLQNAFCAVRPPGHHCERGESMGFCLLANAAIAATHLLNQQGVARVAIVDWDVHHGNGTQHIFEESADVLVCNVHGHPDHVYPGTGYAHESGKGNGKGATLNVPLLPGSGDGEYRAAFENQILPRLEDFKPEFVIISAGFDAHALDPLAPLNLKTESFGWMTECVMDVARQFAQGRLVSLLEGGYDLTALSESVCQHVQTLQNHSQ